jgi:vacuolar protein sorting-associated protein 35
MFWRRSIYWKVSIAKTSLVDSLQEANIPKVITKVFPDEYHLHTLDLLLSNIARLNPYVDMKKIVIGLMDRLSSYAIKDAEQTDDPAKKKEHEEEAVAKLLENFKLAEEKKAKKAEKASAEQTQENGAATEEPAAAESSSKPSEEQDTNGVKAPAETKLYETFYEQVVNLIKSRGLPIQDTIALLVSLINLAL